MLPPCEALDKEEETAAASAQVDFPGGPPANAGDVVREDPTGPGATGPMCQSPSSPARQAAAVRSQSMQLETALPATGTQRSRKQSRGKVRPGVETTDRLNSVQGCQISWPGGAGMSMRNEHPDFPQP